jgi:hypothetical protein
MVDSLGRGPPARQGGSAARKVGATLCGLSDGFLQQRPCSTPRRRCAQAEAQSAHDTAPTPCPTRGPCRPDLEPRRPVRHLRPLGGRGRGPGRRARRPAPVHGAARRECGDFASLPGPGRVAAAALHEGGHVCPPAQCAGRHPYALPGRHGACDGFERPHRSRPRLRRRRDPRPAGRPRGCLSCRRPGAGRAPGGPRATAGAKAAPAGGADREGPGRTGRTAGRTLADLPALQVRRHPVPGLQRRPRPDPPQCLQPVRVDLRLAPRHQRAARGLAVLQRRAEGLQPDLGRRLRHRDRQERGAGPPARLPRHRNQPAAAAPGAAALYLDILDILQAEVAPHMRRYARLRRRVLGLDKLLYCDIKAPLDPDFNPPSASTRHAS